MSLDISPTVEPNSAQLNFDDVQTTDLVITITGVKQGPPDQPVELHNAEFPGRPYKPGKSMRRVLIAAWGTDAAVYVGKQVRLYGDPTIKFGKEAIGGIRIRALSHISGPLTVQLTVTRGKRAPFVVEPLSAPLPDGWEQDVAACETVDDLTEFYEMAAAGGWWSPVVAQACTARKQALNATDS